MPRRPWPLRRVLLCLLGVAVLAAVPAALFVPRAWLTGNDVTTGKHPGYPELQPRRYDFPPDQTITFVAAAAARIPRWRTVSLDREAGVVEIAVRTAIGGFTDDVTVRVTPIGERSDSSLVVIRSRSRVGRADLGENARHIRALQAIMDERLPRLGE